jgi:anti-sigma-K factor RskA
MKCESVLELIPSYALGALEPSERRRVEQHIETCPDCAEELRASLTVSSNLSKAFPSAQPSVHLKTALMRQVRDSAEKSARPSFFRPSFRWQGAFTTGFGIAAMALLVLSVFLVNRVEIMDDEMAVLRTNLSVSDDTINTLSVAVKQQRSLAYTLAIPGMHVIMGEGSGGKGMLMASEDGSWGLLVSTSLQELPSDRAYQVWLMGSVDRESGGMLTVDDTGWGQVTLKPDRTLNAFQSVEVTVEPVEGSPAPTGPMVLQADMVK